MHKKKIIKRDKFTNGTKFCRKALNFWYSSILVEKEWNSFVIFLQLTRLPFSIPISLKNIYTSKKLSLLSYHHHKIKVNKTRLQVAQDSKGIIAAREARYMIIEQNSRSNRDITILVFSYLAT